MPKIEIDVDQVLTAAVALEIEPGDRVFVMNGLVVGLVEKPKLRPEVAVMPEPPTPMPVARKPRTSRAVDPMAVTSVLRDGAMNARAIGNRLELDKRGREHLKTCLRKLRDQHVVVAVDATRFPRLQLNPRHAANGAHAPLAHQPS